MEPTKQNEDDTGCWFDPVRQRWRVRLYLKGRVFHLSYHHDKVAADQAYDRAKSERAVAVPKQRVPLTRTDTTSLLKTLLDVDY